MYSSLLWNYRAGFAYSIEELDGNAPLAQADRTDPQADHQHGDDPNKQPRFFSKERFLKGCDRDTRVLHAALVSFFVIVSTNDLHVPGLPFTICELSNVYSVHHGPPDKIPSRI